MIRYKVVDKNGGSCTVPRRSRKFHRQYNKDDTVHAAEGSAGIMVFKTQRLARAFFFRPGLKILRVRSIGKALKKPRFIFLFRRDDCGKNLAFFYRLLKKNKSTAGLRTNLIPSGTLFYRAVKVLD